MWGCGEQEQVSLTRFGYFMDKLMPLLLLARTYAAGFCCRMRFVHNDKVRAMGKEQTATGITLGEIDANDEVLIVLINAQVAAGEVAL